MSGEDSSSQGRIVHELAEHATDGQVRPITTTQLEGLSVQIMGALPQTATGKAQKVVMREATVEARSLGTLPGGLVIRGAGPIH